MCNNALSLNESKSDVYLAAKDVLKRGEEFIGDSLKKWQVTVGQTNHSLLRFPQSSAHVTGLRLTITTSTLPTTRSWSRKHTQSNRSLKSRWMSKTRVPLLMYHFIVESLVLAHLEYVFHHLPAPSASLRLGSLLRISAPKFEAKEHSWNGATPGLPFWNIFHLCCPFDSDFG